MKDFISHYGVLHKSGRYPWGSGSRPYQSDEKQKKKKQESIEQVLGKKIPKERLVSRNEINKDSPLTVSKGKTVQHITGVPIKELKPGQLYATATEFDNKLYETFLSSVLKTKGFRPEKVELSLKTDLKSPSSNRQREIYEETLKKEEVLDDLSNWMVKKGKVSDKKEAIDQLNRKSEDEIYMDFINSLETSSNSRTSFYERLKEEGFNAVLDEHDRESWIKAKQPIIIMEVLDVVGDIKIEEVDNQRISDALEEWLKLNK